MLSVAKKSERELLDEVVRLLEGKFVQLPVGLIATVIEDAYMHFEQSAIRDYILLLVERRAHKELARLASDPALSVELTPAVCRSRRRRRHADRTARGTEHAGHGFPHGHAP